LPVARCPLPVLDADAITMHSPVNLQVGGLYFRIFSNASQPLE